jgi:hypothetical protein
LEKPIIPPKRDDFISINLVNSDDLRQRQALGLTGVPGVGSNNFATTPLVPGPPAAREQTGLTAAELLELSDEELRKYIPRKTIGQGVGSTARSYDATPSPEEFREQLQRELNPDPGSRGFLLGPRRYNPIDTSPRPTQDKRLGALLDIQGTGGNLSRELPPGFTPPNVAPPPLMRTNYSDRFRDIRPIDGLPQDTGPALIKTPIPITNPALTVEPDPRRTIGTIEPMPTPTIEPAPTTLAAVATDVGAVPDTTMPIGAIDPVLLQQATAETLTDPLIRSLYFGTADSPGFFQQLQQAGANLIGSDVPLQQTAGLTPLEVLARQQAVAGIGGFEPFLQQNRELVNQAIAQSRRAEQLQDPYYTQAEQIYQDTMGAYDPSMTQQFFNPFEDAVVQQTISDVLEAGEQQDIAARAREIGAGAFGGSRARLGAMERREALGEGLAQALGRIRQQGFSEAQRTGLGEFARQQQAKRTGAQGLIGIGTGRGSAAGNLAQRLAGFGGQMTDLGRTQEQLRSGQRRELAGFGATGRGIAETGLGRIFEQQMGQQMRPLGVLGQIGSMLPGYQASKTQIDSQYGMPTDPTAAGLGAAFSAYGALAPRQGSS